jgi:anti-sigma B factor antagonist
VAEAAFGRLIAATGSRCRLPVDLVERAATVAVALAAHATPHLSAPGDRIELTVLEFTDSLQVTVGPLRDGAASALAAGAGDEGSLARIAAHATTIRAGEDELLSFEILAPDGLEAALAPAAGLPADFSAVEQTHDSGIPVVAVAGEIDVATAPALRLAARHALAGGGNRLILDLTRSTFLDSTGIRILIGLAGYCAEDGGIAIANVSNGISRALEVTGLGAVFSVHASVDEAARALASL